MGRALPIIGRTRGCADRLVAAGHHLPLAMDKFHAEKGWRFWSRSDPSVHYALYQFKDMATLRNRLDSPDFKMLVADFDQYGRG
jgi:hypothetical protein